MTDDAYYPTLKEADANLREVKARNRRRVVAEGRAYHAWLDQRLEKRLTHG